MPSPVRYDALPEYHQYVDEGCAFHSSCLSCPASVCRYDARKGIQTLHNEYRDLDIITARRQYGHSVSRIARRHHVSKRTVQRILADSRRAT